MKKIAFRVNIYLLFIVLFVCCGNSTAQVIVTVSNKNDIAVKNTVVCLNDKGFLSWMNSSVKGNLEVVCNKEKLTWQKVIDGTSGKITGLLVQCDFEPKQVKKLSVKQLQGPYSSFPKMTQAELSVKEGGEWKKVVKENGNEQYEYIGGTFKNIQSLRVPEQHTDHSFYIRYEGPGWESDKIGYRFYLDWRNAIDLYGKKTTNMVLQNVGQDGFESYHNEADWGMDILKVGNSLGLGTFAYWDGTNALRVAKTDSVFSEITENNTLRSEITTHYYGWKDAGKPVNLVAKLSILAGSRLTKVDLTLSDTLSNMCTGLVKMETGELIESESDGGWAYMATFGKQSLNNDMMGLFIFYNTNDLKQLTCDPLSYVVVLKPNDKKVSYYLGATWEKDMDGIKTKEAFIEYLDKTMKLLNNPVSVSYN